MRGLSYCTSVDYDTATTIHPQQQPSHESKLIEHIASRFSRRKGVNIIRSAQIVLQELMGHHAPVEAAAQRKGRRTS